ALGYRMEKKPALPPEPPKAVAETTPVVERPAADAVVAESEAGPVESAPPSDDANVAAPTIAVETAEIADITPDIVDVASDDVVAQPKATASLLPEVAFAPAAEAETTAADLQPDPAVAAAVEVSASTAEAGSTEVVAETPSSGQTGSEAAADTAEATVVAEPVSAEPVIADPVMVEVWRPGGRADEQRRPRHDRSATRNRQPDRANAAAPASAEAGEAANAARPSNDRNRHRRPDFRKPRSDAPAEANAAPRAAGEAAPDRPQGNRPPREAFKGPRDNNRDGAKGGDRFKGKPQGDRDKFKGRGDRDGRRDDRGGGAALRQYASSAPPQRERDRPADPNSPFAKLAALKEQLASGRKDH
ncbi:MAG: helicase-like, partial [Tardiphaga sp.]|nr:helicase-like [Tardiphaga sp.]